jgi:Lipid-A-disaccharide synthetase
MNPGLTQAPAVLNGEVAPAGAGVRSRQLVLVANSPGEVSYLAIPMARAAKQWASSTGLPLSISLILPPCQWASGREASFAHQAAAFERIFSPRDCLAFAARLRRFPEPGPGCVVHFGGDLWYSATLARRFRFAAFAYVEASQPILRRARWFSRVFLPSSSLADHLIALGAPKERLAVVGDLRVEHLQSIRSTAPRAHSGSRVALLPGSRRWIVSIALPYILELVPAMRALRPDVTFSLIASPFLSRHDLERTLARRGATLPELGIEIVEHDHLRAMAGCDLALTYPGSNNDELAILGVPMLVVLPLEHVSEIRTPGLSEWLGRIPGVANFVKAVVVGRYLRHHRLLAWPNQHAGRMVVPELVGRLTPTEVARRAMQMLDDRSGLARMSQELRALYASTESPARRMLEELAPFLERRPDHHAA